MEFLLHCGPKCFWLLLTPVILTTIGKLLSFISGFCESIILLFSTRYFQKVFQQILTVFNAKNSISSLTKCFLVSLVSLRLIYRSFHLKFKIIEKIGWREKQRRIGKEEEQTPTCTSLLFKELQPSNIAEKCESTPYPDIYKISHALQHDYVVLIQK